MTRLWRIAALVACLCAAAGAASDYPLTLTVEAKASTPTAAVTSNVTIRVDRLMEESRRKRVTDALTYNGYAGFLTTLRSLPRIGTIELQARSVDIRYAHEPPDEGGRRLVLVADRPLFFLGNPQAKARAGYELTMVELRFDAQGRVTGTLLGAARVKPAPGGLTLDDYADVRVSLAPHGAPPPGRNDERP